MTRSCKTCKQKEIIELATKGLNAYEYCIQDLEKKFVKIKDICQDAVDTWNKEEFYEDDTDIFMGENNMAVKILEILQME